MPQKPEHIKPKVDPELIRCYLAGELDDKAMHALERQALDDPFLAEALEGFAEHAPDQQLHLADLESRLAQRVQEDGQEKATAGKVRRISYRWAAAAAVLLLAGIGALWMWKPRTPRQPVIAKTEALIPGNGDSSRNSDSGALAGAAASPAADSRDVAIQRVKPAATGHPSAQNTAIPASTPADAVKPAAAPPVSTFGATTRKAAEVQNSEPALADAARVKADRAAPRMAMKKVVPPSTQISAKHNITADSPATLAKAATGDSAALTADARNFIVRGNQPAASRESTYTSKQDIAIAKQDAAVSRYSATKSKQDAAAPGQDGALTETVVVGGEKKTRTAPAPKYGFDNFRAYLAASVKYPTTAQEKNVSGIVRISFRVMPDGKLEDFKVIRKLQKDCDAEAIRAVKEGPDWLPASNGKAVRVKVDVHFPPGKNR